VRGSTAGSANRGKHGWIGRFKLQPLNARNGEPARLCSHCHRIARTVIFLERSPAWRATMSTDYGVIDHGRGIDSLHDDVLILIFHLSRDLGSGREFDSAGRYIREQLKISHVCHRWRVLSIGSPNLWTSFSHVHPEWNAECLLRSQDALITIDFGGLSGEECALAIPFISEQMPRIVTLTLGLQGERDSLCSVLAQPAMNLKSFKLDYVDWSSLPLNFILFSGCCPRLRSMHLDGCAFSWNDMLPSFRHLTHLAILDCQDIYELSPPVISPSTSPATIDDVHYVLLNTPDLSSLHIRYSLPYKPDLYSWVPKHRVKLPHLRNLVLADEMNSLLPFINGLELVPRSLRRIQITVIRVQYIPAAGEMIVQIALFMLTHAMNDVFEYLSLKPCEITLKSAEDEGVPTLNFVVSTTFEYDFSLEMYRLFVRCLQLRSLKSINITSLPSLNADFWENLGTNSCCHSLTLDALDPSSVFSFLHVLLDDLHPSTASDYFPALKCLELVDADFSARSETGDLLGDAFCDVLERRSAKGFGFAEIRIRKPMTDIQENNLRRIYGAVLEVSYVKRDPEGS
jgi:hypothetical protein